MQEELTIGTKVVVEDRWYGRKQCTILEVLHEEAFTMYRLSGELQDGVDTTWFREDQILEVII